MKLKKEFITYTSGGESLLVPTSEADFSGLVRGNRTFGEILALLKTETDEASILAALRSKFDGPEAVIAADVRTALEKLREIGALEE